MRTLISPTVHNHRDKHGCLWSFGGMIAYRKNPKYLEITYSRVNLSTSKPTWKASVANPNIVSEKRVIKSLEPICLPTRDTHFRSSVEVSAGWIRHPLCQQWRLLTAVEDCEALWVSYRDECWLHRGNVKVSPYTPEEALRVPGGWGSQDF